MEEGGYDVAYYVPAPPSGGLSRHEVSPTKPWWRRATAALAISFGVVCLPFSVHPEGGWAHVSQGGAAASRVVVERNASQNVFRIFDLLFKDGRSLAVSKPYKVETVVQEPTK